MIVLMSERTKARHSGIGKTLVRCRQPAAIAKLGDHLRLANVLTSFKIESSLGERREGGEHYQNFGLDDCPVQAHTRCFLKVWLVPEHLVTVDVTV